MIGSLVRLRPDYWQIKRSLFLNSLARLQMIEEFFFERTDEHIIELIDDDEHYLETAENLLEFQTQSSQTIRSWGEIITAMSYWTSDATNRPHLPYFSPKMTFNDIWGSSTDDFNGFLRSFGLYEIDNLWMTRQHDDVYGFEPDPEIIKNHPLSKNLLVTDFIEADRFRMLPVTPDKDLEEIEGYYNRDHFFKLKDIAEVTSRGMIKVLQPELGVFLKHRVPI
jgi:hypothetical protein